MSESLALARYCDFSDFGEAGRGLKTSALAETRESNSQGYDYAHQYAKLLCNSQGYDYNKSVKIFRSEDSLLMGTF